MDTATARRQELLLLRRYCDTGDFRARDTVIEGAMPLVHTVAARYANRGVDHEELVQVGAVGLVKAVDRFDPDRGLAFSSFAVPNIAGEIRRWFRDHSHALRLPRDVQEHADELRSHAEALTTAHGRRPTLAELTQASGLPAAVVLEVQAATHEVRVTSLDAAVTQDADAVARVDTIGDVDHGYEVAEVRTLARTGLAALRDRERLIVRLRYEDGLTQSEIAQRVGISQMHVSRLLRRAIEDMRETLDADAG
ncbi:SigB/SigF/SigG family RNA polymerase sigma factor [Conexibacter sp. W3-3-2]|uniref:SigB/SigF/SigG family RNA polymerase sigma factor n=1 Tax=Conexibacter sp. W3-3-2 TaxID=2675227 RepID=UPI0018A99963|nr:SigB/SigF/SigG family RNA polymerase sigma factor [Conexibacter sp. W3-3-2]